MFTHHIKSGRPVSYWHHARLGGVDLEGSGGVVQWSRPMTLRVRRAGASDERAQRILRTHHRLLKDALAVHHGTPARARDLRTTGGSRRRERANGGTACERPPRVRTILRRYDRSAGASSNCRDAIATVPGARGGRSTPSRHAIAHGARCSHYVP